MIMLLSQLYPIVLLCVLVTGVTGNIHCQEKEKAMLDLDIAEDLIEKLKHLFPNCTDILANNTGCGVKEKITVHLDKMKTLIEEAKDNFPSCVAPITNDPKITETPTSKEPKTISTLTQTTVTAEPVSETTVTVEPETETSLTEKPVTEPHEYPKSRDCWEVLQSGRSSSGVYTIWPDHPVFQNRSLDVYCDMDTDNGGWTVIQRRGNFTPQEDFNRDWNDYQKGFGNLTRDFWLGNDNLFALTTQGQYEVRFELESAEGDRASASYESFRIENEADWYMLRLGRFSGGEAGDAMGANNGHSFLTKDKDNSFNCAQKRKGGWWHYACGYVNLNGPYNPGAKGGDGDFIHWYHWKHKRVGLAGSEIKIRPLRSSRKTLS